MVSLNVLPIFLFLGGGDIGFKNDFGCPRGNDVTTVSGLNLMWPPSPVVCKGFDSYPSNNNYCQYYKEYKQVVIFVFKGTWPPGQFQAVKTAPHHGPPVFIVEGETNLVSRCKK